MPVTKLEASLANHVAALATSSGGAQTIHGVTAGEMRAIFFWYRFPQQWRFDEAGANRVNANAKSPYSTAVFRVSPPTAYFDAT